MTGQSSEPTAEGLTEAAIEAIVQDDMRYWLGNPFMDPNDLVGKVCWWINTVLADRLAAAEEERQAEEDRANENATLVHQARAERDDLRAALDRVKAERHVVHVTSEPVAEDVVWCDECEEWVMSGAPEGDRS